MSSPLLGLGKDFSIIYERWKLLFLCDDDEGDTNLGECWSVCVEWTFGSGWHAERNAPGDEMNQIVRSL